MVSKLVGRNVSRSLVKEMACGSCDFVDELEEMGSGNSMAAVASIEWRGVMLLLPPLMMLVLLLWECPACLPP